MVDKSVTGKTRHDEVTVTRNVHTIADYCCDFVAWKLRIQYGNKRKFGTSSSLCQSYN